MDPHADPPAVETTPLLGLPQETKIPTIMPMKYRACIPAADLVSSWTHSKHTRALIGDIWRGTEVIRKGFVNDPVQAGYFGVRLQFTLECHTEERQLLTDRGHVPLPDPAEQTRPCHLMGRGDMAMPHAHHRQRCSGHEVVRDGFWHLT